MSGAVTSAPTESSIGDWGADLAAMHQRDQYVSPRNATRSERDRHRLLGMLDAALATHTCTACLHCESFGPCACPTTQADL